MVDVEFDVFESCIVINTWPFTPTHCYFHPTHITMCRLYNRREALGARMRRSTLHTPVVRTTSPSRVTQLLAMGWIPSMPATLLSPSPLGVRHLLLVCSGRSLPTASWEWTMPTQHFGSKCMIRMRCRSKSSACASIGSRSLPRMVQWLGPSH